MKRQLPKAQYYAVLERDNFTCRYCGETAKNVKLEIDHVIPFSRGGQSTEENTVTSCSPCNRKKRANEFTGDFADPHPEAILYEEVRENIPQCAKTVGKSLLLMINADLHRSLKQYALTNGISMKAAILKAIEQLLTKGKL